MVGAADSALVVIDDSEDDVFLFQRLVRSAEIPNKVLPFCSGEEAIKYFGGVATGSIDPPLACFLDVNMPGCDGFAVLDAIRASDELAGISIIMLSSSDDERDLDRAAKKGAQCYLVKHPSPAAFRAVVEDAKAFSANHATTEAAFFQVTANLLAR